ncbi:MAG: hypothetical protein EBX50_13745 [Chitinophagia bacterium]|nr:hypothetical protein [Chitinophagia bacterium]
MVLVVFGLVFGINKLIDINKIKANWAEQRCSPLIMPFASLFGYNTKENFDFCMGKTFNTFSMPFFGSAGQMFSQFTGLLTNIFDSISSIRNIIASLGGGINVVFQEFTERISNFFFKLRLSAIRIKMLIGRMYAILFSIMYMGLSGITGMTSFTNTFLFSFLDTFCFPKDTAILVKGKGRIPIQDIRIGDVLLPTNSRVTGTFQFYSRGQPMVKLDDILVSTNHYVVYEGKNIKAGEHPMAIRVGVWESDEPLYCLDTDNHRIPVGNFEFLDYGETDEGDKDTMHFIQNRINGVKNDCTQSINKFQEYSPAFSETIGIQTKQGVKPAKDIQINDKLSTGSTVVGLIRKEVKEVCQIENDSFITPCTLYWNPDKYKWERFGETKAITLETRQLVSFIVVPNSQIELESGVRVRDYMELCSPDAETHYSEQLEAVNAV